MAKSKSNVKPFIIFQPYFFGGHSKFYSDGLSKYRVYNTEDLDIFSNPNYVQPSIIFQDDNITGITDITGFTLSSKGYLYALGKNGSGKAVVYYKTTPTGSSPSSWTLKFTSANSPATQGYSPITAFITEEGGATKEYLYYHTGSGTLSRYGDLNGTPTETASFGTLSGLTTDDRLVHLIFSGDLFIGNGGYIARVTRQGNFVDKSFTLPTGLRVVDMVPMILTSGGSYIAVLCKDTNNPTQSQVILTDTFSSSGVIAKVRVPLAKPQWIQQVGTNYLIGGVNPNNQFEIYAMTGLIISDAPVFIIPDVSYDLSRPVSPITTKYTSTNTFLFGIEGTKKSGIYAIGEPLEDQLAISMMHRFNTSYYGNHRPLAFIAINDAKYVSYYDGNDEQYYVRIANQKNPTYSSQAILETLLYTGDSPYFDKSWNILQVGLQPLPSLCSISVSGRTNTTEEYRPINPVSNVIDTPNIETQDIPIVGFNSKMIQLKFSFTSSGSTRPQLKWLALNGFINTLF